MVFGASCAGGGAASATGFGSSFLPQPDRKMADAAILVIATKECLIMVRALLETEGSAAPKIPLLRHHRQHEVLRARYDRVFPALLGLFDPEVPGPDRRDVKTQAAPLVHDVATNARRPI